MTHSFDRKATVLIQWGTALMMIGFLSLTTGCGSASKSLGGTSSTTTSGGIVNASAEDVTILKSADKKMSPMDTSSGSSASWVSNKGVHAGGNVTIAFNNPQLQAYLTQNGSLNKTYATTQYFANRGYGNPTNNDNWDATENEYSWDGGHYRVAISKGAPCPSCYFTYFQEKQADGATLNVMEDKGRYKEVMFRLREYSTGIATTEQLEITKEGIRLRLTEAGRLQYNTSNGQLLSYGPLEITKNNQTYTLTLKTSLPVDMSTLSTLVYKIQNAQSQEIGEATFTDVGTITFKVYQNGVLTPVASL